MSNPPIISVVIPAYNAERTLAATIQSVLHQTYQDFEIIIVDDGSIDETPSIAQSFGQQVRHIRQARSNPATARNHGATESQGEWVAFLDADDLWLPQKLQRQMQFLERYPQVDAVQTGAYLVNNALQVVEVRNCHPGHDAYVDLLLFRNLPAFSSSLLIRKQCFLGLGGFSTDLIMETWDMACRIARYGTLKSLPECLVLYRQHLGNRSRDVKLHYETGLRSLSRLFADPSLDPSVRLHQKHIWARFYAMLAGGYFRNRQWADCLNWAWKALATSPCVVPYLVSMPVRRFHRSLSLVRQRSFANEFPFATAQ